MIYLEAFSKVLPVLLLLAYAVMTMFVVQENDQAYVVNTLSLATLVTLAAFTLVSVFYAV